MVSRANIVLNSTDENSQKAVLSLECDGQTTKGKLRLYNFNSEPQGIISLGIYYDGNVVKAGLTKSSYMLFTFQSEITSLPKFFSCAVVNFVGGEPKPILYGCNEGYAQKESVIDEVVGKLSNVQSMDEVEDVLDRYKVDFDQDYKKEIEEQIDSLITKEDISMCNNNCDDCEYKKYYFSQVKSLNNLEEEKIEEKSFYSEMKNQIDKIFENNPDEEYLQELLPNSKFVKVKLDDDNYYVLGLIYSDNELKYICYGVPGIYQKVPPRELSGFPIWFPLDQDKPEGFGYWLTYQDAESGESVKAIVV